MSIAPTLVCTFAVSPDGLYLGAGTAEGAVVLIDQPTLKTIKTVSAHGLPVSGLAFVNEPSPAVVEGGNKGAATARGRKGATAALVSTHLVSASPDKSCAVLAVSPQVTFRALSLSPPLSLSLSLSRARTARCKPVRP